MPDRKPTIRAVVTDPTAQSHFQFGHHPKRHMIVSVMLALCVAGATTACGSESHQEGRMPQSGFTGATTDQATIDEALRFGGIALPTSAKILAVQYDEGIDQSYRLVVEIEPDSLQTLLSGSGFTTPLEPDPGPFMEPIKGFDLKAATTVFSTRDSLAPDGERTSTVFRRVAVDRSQPAKPVVHMWLFTT